MRGKALGVSGRLLRLGITPAYAGKSSGLSGIQKPKTDHPRVCGEKSWSTIELYVVMGSPPRMRGKVITAAPGAGCDGITPAYAGKSSQLLTTACGCAGSPPRMRGKGPLCRYGIRALGITPAYAGKRLKRSRSTVPPVAIVPLFPSVCNKPVVSDGSPAGRDAPLFLPDENAAPASPAYNLRSL